MKKQAQNRKVQSQNNKTQKNTTPPVADTPVQTTAGSNKTFVEQYLPYLIIVVLSFVLYWHTLPYDYVLDDKAVITNNQFTKKGLSGVRDIMGVDIFEGIAAKRKDYVAGGRYRPLSLVTYAIEWEFTADYTLTQNTLQVLQSQQVPAEVIQQLTPFVDKEMGKRAYESTLHSAIGEAQWTTYKDVIMSSSTAKGYPNIHHFINILLYALTGALIYKILLKLFDTRMAAGLENLSETVRQVASRWYFSVPFVATLLYVVHPLHTEAVASIKGRDEIMVFLGSLLVLWYSVRFFESRKWWYLVANFAIFLLSFLSKENAITFIAVIPLTIYYFGIREENKNPRRRSGIVYDRKGFMLMLIPLLAAFITFWVIRRNVLGAAATAAESTDLMNNPFFGTSFGERYATIFLTLGMYLKLLLVPHPLTFDYYPKHIPIINWLDWRAIVPLLLYVAMGIYSLYGFAKRSILSYSILFFLATFSIVSNIFFSIGAFMSERFMYISSLGFTLSVAYLLLIRLPEYLTKKEKSITAVMRIVPVVLVLMAGLYAAKTIDRNGAWKDEFTLFTTDVKTSVHSAKGNYAAGFAWVEKGKVTTDSTERATYYERGIGYLNQALVEHPGYENVLVYLGSSYYEYNKNYEGAIDAYLRVLQLYPNYDKVHGYVSYILTNDPNVPLDYKVETLHKLYKINSKRYEVVYNLAFVLYQTKKYDEAVKYFEAAAVLRPQEPMIYKLLGVCYGSMGQLQKSMDSFLKALKITPNDPQVYANLAKIHQSMGQIDKAQFYNQKAVELSGAQQK